MATILDKIIETKRDEVAKLRAGLNESALVEAAQQAPPPRGFIRALLKVAPSGIHVIAETKKASPSAGVIVEDYRPERIAASYERNGASAISVLTDRTYFQGDPAHLTAVRSAVTLPVLRKEFIIDPVQVYEARAIGADAVLLIAEALETDLLVALYEHVRSLEMDALIEVHSTENAYRVGEALGLPSEDTYLLGINNRDLRVQKTDLTTTLEHAKLLPPGTPFVSESGISTPADVDLLRKAGATAILVGESLLRASDPGEQLAALLSPVGH